MWVGVDDTDSPRGGCTTFVLTELLRVARSAGLDLLGEPRLVRLNPNIPWKTRGNAALAARFGRGRGPRRRVGWVGARPLYGYARGEPPSEAATSEFAARAWAAVTAASSLGDARVDPALVITRRRLPASLYWRTVREVVPVSEVERLLRSAGALVRTHGSRRGVVGASAAIAWPGRRATWELLAYRRAGNLGRPRRVDPGSVLRAQEEFPDLFLCADGRTRRILVSPHTACPILFGLRSTRRAALGPARSRIRSEAVDRWVIFRTNQGSGDHVTDRSVAELGPYGSGRVRGTVLEGPHTGPGGHVRLVVRDAGGDPLDCLVFEPTKTLPPVARSLRPGDRVEVWGGRGADRALRVEGLRVLSVVPRPPSLRPPVCPSCDRPAHSLGTGRGYRCEVCRRRFPPEAARRGPGAPAPRRGTYHPTPSARRHLAFRGPEAPWPPGSGGRIYTGGG